MDEDEVTTLVEAMLLETPEAELASGRELEELLGRWLVQCAARGEPVREVSVFWSAGRADVADAERHPVMTFIPERCPECLPFEAMLTVQVDRAVYDREEDRVYAEIGRRWFSASDLVLLCLAPSLWSREDAPANRWHGRWIRDLLP